MKDRSVAEIDEMFRLKLKAREFEKWRGEDTYSSDVSA
jgi:hypothetical protein